MVSMSSLPTSAGAPLRRAILAIACVLPACGEGGDDLQGSDPPAVVEVAVDAPATTIAVGESVQLEAVALDAEGNALDGRAVEWASANPEIATVSESGVVAGLAAGQAGISATVEEVTGSVTITVSSEPPPPPPPPPPPGSGEPGLERIAGGLDFPLYLTSPPQDERLFVVERGGTIRIIQGGAVLPEPFLDISAQVSEGGEQGLLGLVFFPDYATSGRFLIHYSDFDGNTQLAVVRVSEDPNRADPVSETPILGLAQANNVHQGGQIAFGPDGMLYLGLGDGGSQHSNDQGRAQSLEDLFGSVLRIDVSSGTGYTVPGDNPFVGRADAQPEIWSYGLRNPWRFSFDRVTGDLYIADVGASRWEEVNRGRAAEGAARGVNYGWSVMEGPGCVRPDCDQTGLTLPTVAYRHDTGCSIIGGYVYRGEALPSLQGQYLFGDFCQGWVKSFPAGDESPEPVDQPDLSPGGNITSLGEDAAGELYVLTADGSVFKIVPR
jgi:glucose/arabinose dehydrogenase